MRRSSLILTALFALCAAIPASAQVADQVRGRTFEFFSAAPGSNEPQTKPEVVVARLMSFDQNHDGRLTRAELPERMHILFARVPVAGDDSLDRAAVQQFAEAPPVQVVVRGFQPGHYGFGEDTGFDSRLHIEGAIEDLRLASDARDKALGIGRTFADKVQVQARADLIATATAMLTPEQLTSLKATLDQELNVNIKSNDQAAVEKVKAALTTQMRLQNLSRLVAQYSLADDQKRQLQAALENYNAHRLTDAERSALLGKLEGILTHEQADDLRAALERRPIMKQEGLAFSGAAISIQGNPTQVQKVQVSF